MKNLKIVLKERTGLSGIYLVVNSNRKEIDYGISLKNLKKQYPAAIWDKEDHSFDEDEIEKYRFETGSLYIYDSTQNGYIHCWKNALDNTKAKAIKSYEEFLECEIF